MTKGIMSPWSEEKEPEVVEDIFEETKYSSNVCFTGRTYKIIINTPIKNSDKNDAKLVNVRANTILGELIKTLSIHSPQFRKLLADQQIFQKDIPIINKYTIKLGDVILYYAASSLDQDLAKAMFIDRLCLVFNEINKRDKTAAETTKKAKVLTCLIQ